jgi:hypothetical protein
MNDEALDRAERGRLALLRGLDEIERALDGHAVAVAVGKDVPPLDEVIRKATTHAHELHRRAWSSWER